MGKKQQRQQVKYSRQALENMAFQLSCIRQPLKGGMIPKIQIDLDELEKTIGTLSKKERELLEKFWGLIPGTTNHGKQINKKHDIAYQNMMKHTLEVMKKLLSIEYLYRYDQEAKHVVNEMLGKINKEGVEYVSDIDAIKYLILFLIFFVGGPRMLFEGKEDKINLKEEENGHFDEYALLKVTWEESGRVLQDKSIKLKLLIEAIRMFDLKDVVAMQRFVNLPISKDDYDVETEVLSSFKQIRLFKEKIFPYGAWDVSSSLIYGSEINDIDLTELVESFSMLRANWESIATFKTKQQITLYTSEGERQLDCYKIGKLTFTDIYEVMFLYVSRSLL